MITGTLVITSVLLAATVGVFSYESTSLPSSSTPSDEKTTETVNPTTITTEKTSNQTTQFTEPTSHAVTSEPSQATTAEQHVPMSFNGGAFFGGAILGMAIMTVLYGVYMIWIKKRSTQSGYDAY